MRRVKVEVNEHSDREAWATFRGARGRILCTIAINVYEGQKRPYINVSSVAAPDIKIEGLIYDFHQRRKMTAFPDQKPTALFTWRELVKKKTSPKKERR